MRIETIDTPAEADLRFLRYRLEVIGGWPASPRKAAAAEAISQRLTALARSVLVRPDNADLLHLSCQLLDDFFAAGLCRFSYRPPKMPAKHCPAFLRWVRSPIPPTTFPRRWRAPGHRANRRAQERRSRFFADQQCQSPTARFRRCWNRRAGAHPLSRRMPHPVAR